MKHFAIALLISAASGFGQQPNSPGSNAPTNAVVVSSEFVNRLIAEARTNNPSLRAADSKVRAADSKVRAAEYNAQSIRAWEDPAALLGGSVYSDKGFKPSEDGDLAYGVEQKLPLWSSPKLARQVAQTEVFMRQAEATYRTHQVRRHNYRALSRNLAPRTGDKIQPSTFEHPVNFQRTIFKLEPEKRGRKRLQSTPSFTALNHPCHVPRGSTHRQSTIAASVYSADFRGKKSGSVSLLFSGNSFSAFPDYGSLVIRPPSPAFEARPIGP
jgi:hypothetical protein